MLEEILISQDFNMWKIKYRFSAVCVVLLIHLTLKYQSNTLLSLVNGSPRTTAFIIEILSCQVTLHTCQKGLKGTAPAPLLCCSAWFFIALHSRPIHRCFQPYVNIIHFRMWQLLTVRHCGATRSQNLVYVTKRLCYTHCFLYPLLKFLKSHGCKNVLKKLQVSFFEEK